MQQSIILHRKKRDPFSRVPKSISENDELSFAEKGLFCYLAGKPEGWRIIVNDLAKRNATSVYRTREILKKLRDKGYMALVKLREKQLIAGWIWVLSVDSPMFLTQEGLETLGATYELAGLERERLQDLQDRAQSSRRGRRSVTPSQLPKNREVENYDLDSQHLKTQHSTKNKGEVRTKKEREHTNSSAADAGAVAAGPSAIGDFPKEIVTEAREFARKYTTSMSKITRKMSVTVGPEAMLSSARFFQDNNLWAAIDVILVCAQGWIRQMDHPHAGPGFDRYFHARHYATSPSKLFESNGDGQTIVERIAKEIGYNFNADADEAWERLDELIQAATSS